MGRPRKARYWQRGKKNGTPCGPWYTTVGRDTVKLAEDGTPHADVEAAYNALMAKSQETSGRTSGLALR